MGRAHLKFGGPSPSPPRSPPMHIMTKLYLISLMPGTYTFDDKQTDVYETQHCILPTANTKILDVKDISYLWDVVAPWLRLRLSIGGSWVRLSL